MYIALGTPVVDETDELPASTRWHRNHGRQTRREKAIKQQLLTPQEEKAIVEYVLQLYRNGHAARVKHLRYFAQVLLRRRSGSDEASSVRLPGKDWTRAFCKRHLELEAARRTAIDDKRHEINTQPKIVVWFEIMGKQLSERGVLQENVYNMDETGVMLSDLDTVKVLIARGDKEQRRGRALKRTMITAVECISADGRYLPPLVIFPGKTLRSTWVSFETPGWHYGCSETGYNNSTLNLYWVQHVFDPATRDRANGRPRVLIINGFGSYESLDVMTFCFDNNIIICRQPSHATHKLQPCDVGVFSPLKTAYRDQVDQLYRNGAGTVNKAHFTFLYSRARELAMTSRNIRSRWSKAGLYPFNPSRVLDTMQEVPADNNEEIAAAGVPIPVQPMLSPTSLRTPTNAVSLVALQRKLEERQEASSDIDPYLQKLLNAAKQAIARTDLLEVRCDDLMKQNNKKKTRQHVKDRKISEAKIIGYEEIVEALRMRDRKEAEREQKAARKATNKVSKSQATGSRLREQPQDAIHSALELAGMSTYCSVFPLEPADDVGNVRHLGHAMDISPGSVWPTESMDIETPWQAPVARMY